MKTQRAGHAKSDRRPDAGARCAGSSAVFLLTRGSSRGRATVADAATIPTGPDAGRHGDPPRRDLGYVLERRERLHDRNRGPPDPDADPSISLLPAAGRVPDMDWSESTRALRLGAHGAGAPVGGPRGPDESTVQVTNLGANYSPDLRGQPEPMGVDAGGRMLNSELAPRVPGGRGVVPISALPVGTRVEFVEKRVDPNWPRRPWTASSSVGNAAGATVVQVYDRLTAATLALVAYGAAPRTATGITTSKAEQAYVARRCRGAGRGICCYSTLRSGGSGPRRSPRSPPARRSTCRWRGSGSRCCCR